ncbi:MAG TPA: ABC transporter permease, partial [Paenibacillaceae bacterium]|nr:ABC transporter permease [Paenibacillaceae bacterium]
MGNAFKVAKWEFKRNMKNKSFLIGLFLTPILMLGFMILSSLIGDSDNQAKNKTRVFIQDNLGVFNTIQETAKFHQFNWEIHKTEISEKEAMEQLKTVENTAYIFLNQGAINTGIIPVYS